MMRLLAVGMLVGVMACGSQAAETKFTLSGTNTKITFVGTKPQGKHDGGFRVVSGTATVDAANATTLKLTADIDMNSIYADVDKLTNHLKSPDFFSVKNNPKSKFVTTKVEKSGDMYSVTGNLTMNGKTKEVSFPAEIAATATGLTVKSTFKINRHDWGISYGRGMIDDDVNLTVAVSAKK